MTNSRISRWAARAAVLAAGLASAALAQPGPPAPPQSAPQAIGVPRSLPGLERLPAPDAAAGDSAGSATDGEQTSVPAAPGILGQSGGSAVTISALGEIEGPPTGLLVSTDGGFAEDMWSGSDRRRMEALMTELPIATPIESVRTLARRVVLSRAATPYGAASQAFLTLRLRRLLDAGFIDDAAALAAIAQVANDPEFARVQADAILFAGQKERVCGDTTSTRLASAEPFWMELRAYCYAMAGDDAALSLTRAVMDAQNLDHSGFDTLLDDATTHVANDPGEIDQPTALDALLLGQADLPVSPEIGGFLGTPGLLLAMRSEKNSPEQRLNAAERVLRSGAVSPGELAAIADAQHFTDDQFATEHVQVEQLPFLAGQALLRQAVARARAEARPALLYEAMSRADREGLLPVAATLQHDEMAQLEPTRAMRGMADLMGRALLLTGDANAAAKWYDILDLNLPSDKPLIAKFQFTLNFVAPNPARTQQAQGAIGEFTAELATASQDDTYASLALGLTAALGEAMPPDAQAALSSALARKWPGRRPAPALLARLSRAMNAPGRKGEALMLILNTIGASGPGDLAPDITVRLVRDLEKQGVPDAAREIAIASLLLYKPAPPLTPAAPPK